jgi:hypothetical protein
MSRHQMAGQDHTTKIASRSFRNVAKFTYFRTAGIKELTPWSRVLFEKLAVTQLVEKCIPRNDSNKSKLHSQRILLLPWHYNPGWALASFTLKTSWQFFSGVGLSAPRPTPNLEDQISIFISPGDWVAQSFYDMQGLQWDYSFPGHHDFFFFPLAFYSPYYADLLPSLMDFPIL